VDRTPGIRVYVLGAGCSYHEQHGYPLAKSFLHELSAYASRLASIPECKRIQAAVEDTAKLLSQCQSGSCHASTIDQLINLILHSRCDDQLEASRRHLSNDIVALRYEAVRKAKIATAACFLEREGRVRQHQMEKYREFIQRNVLNETGVSTPSTVRLQKSSARVLSFNYDRLFELAFYAAFADRYLTQFLPYSSEVFNSGLDAFGEITEIKKDRFCFLKLHGSSGWLCSEDAFGQRAHQNGNVVNWNEEKVTDEVFFPSAKPQAFPPEPMIVFPYEKDYVVSGRDNKLSFRDYIAKVWAHTSHVLQEATEIRVIGYSFDPTDCNYLIERIRQAANCRRIVIQNLPAECERISALLTTDYEIQIPIVNHPIPF
jgi:hypothetical protein